MNAFFPNYSNLRVKLLLTPQSMCGLKTNSRDYEIFLSEYLYLITPNNSQYFEKYLSCR